MKKVFLIILVIIGCIIVTFKVIGFGFGSKSQKIQQEDNGIVYAVTQINTKTDNAKVLSKEEQNLICATSRGLLKKDSDGKISSDLAESYNGSSDGIEFEFKLKDNIYWSDGSKITADDFISFFNDLINTEPSADIEPLLDVFGVADYKKGVGTFDKNVAITKRNNSILIRLNKKNNYFLDELTSPQYRLRKKLVLWADIAKNYKSIPYSGQFYISSFTSDKIAIQKNSKSSDTNIDKITFSKYQSSEYAMASFEVNKVDALFNPPFSQIKRLNENNELISVNSDNGLCMALNEKSIQSLEQRREICKYFYKAVEDFEQNNPEIILSAEGGFFLDDKKDPSKLQNRKVIINDAKPQGVISELTLLSVENEGNKDFSEFLKDYLKINYQIDLKYKLVSENEFEEQKTGNYDIILQTYQGVNNNAFYNQMANSFTEKQKEMLNQLVNIKDQDHSKLESDIFTEFNVFPLYFYKINIARSEKIANLAIDGNQNIDFSLVW